METYKRKDKIIERFSLMLREKIGNQIEQITLYGSRARGDNSAYSDYDFLIIVKKKSKKQKEIIYDIWFTMLDQYEALISFLVYDE